MSASIGVVEEIGPKTVATKMSAIEMPTPSSAVMRGMPAARKEPKVRTRTTRATTTPMSSMMLSVGRLLLNNCPPSDDCAPVGRLSARSASARSRPATVFAVMSDWALSNWIEMRAARWSSETAPVMFSSNGDTACSTWSMRPSEVTASSMADRTAASSTVSPAGATTTIWADAPLTCGKVCSSESSASCDWVPGMEKALSVPWLRSSAPAPASASTAIQRISTSFRARKAQRPRVYSSEDTRRS